MAQGPFGPYLIIPEVQGYGYGTEGIGQPRLKFKALILLDLEKR